MCSRKWYKYILVLSILFLMAGCGMASDKQEALTPAQQEAREKNVFWQYTEPEVQLDPIAEEDTPAVIYPGPGEEEK